MVLLDYLANNYLGCLDVLFGGGQRAGIAHRLSGVENETGINTQDVGLFKQVNSNCIYRVLFYIQNSTPSQPHRAVYGLHTIAISLVKAPARDYFRIEQSMPRKPRTSVTSQTAGQLLWERLEILR